MVAQLRIKIATNARMKYCWMLSWYLYLIRAFVAFKTDQGNL